MSKRVVHYGFTVKRKAGDTRRDSFCYCGAKYPDELTQRWPDVTCKKCRAKRAQVQNKAFESEKREACKSE